MKHEHLFKLGGPEQDGTENIVRWRYGQVYQWEELGDVLRLRIAADERQADLLIALMEAMEEPLFVLYILHTPVAEHAEGRYQSPAATREEVGVFLGLHEPFIERDGRHDLWIAHPYENRPAQQLVLENSNLLYAYGPLDRFEEILRARGFSEGEIVPPRPHTHYYHHELNGMGDEAMHYWPWIHTPLEPADGKQ